MEISPFHRFDGGRGLPVGSRPDQLYEKQQLQHARQANIEYSTHVIEVDSSQRDTDEFPSSSEYTVFFRNPLTNVTRVDLTSAEVPNLSFNVNDSNNTFILEELIGTNPPNTVTCTLPEGHFDITDLTVEIQRQLNLKSSNHTSPYTVSALSGRNKVIFKAASGITRFRLLFEGDNTCCSLLGFDNSNTPYNDTFTSTDPLYSSAIVSTGYVDINEERFLFLSSPELDTTFHEVSYRRSEYGLTSTATPNCFAKLAMVGEPGSVIVYAAGTGFSQFKEFKPPLARLDTLTIRWLRRDGSLVDFKDFDNSIQLQFKCISRSLGSPNFAGYF